MSPNPTDNPSAADDPGAALAALVTTYGLSAGTDRRLAALARILSEDPHAPTSVRDPLAVVHDHIADSLVGLSLDSVAAAGMIADVGSGAGLPGLPLAIALPLARVTLLEAVGRKCDFLVRAAAVCTASNAEVVNARAEAWPDGLGRFDLVTARALARLDVVLEYAAPLLRLGGTLVAWRGRRDPLDEAAGARAAEVLGMEVSEPIAVVPYAGAQHRHLHILKKVGETPGRFPRRPGMARKRPLGGPLTPAAQDGRSSDRDRR